MKTDIEIAQEATMKPITQIAAQLGLADEDVIPYGRYKAKINHRLIHNAKKQGKLILVTAISPTPAGEGKTTTSVGLADAMNALGKKTMLCLREPSLGPVFGIKGGAAGGGYAQVVPMEDINLHFTGDLHAIGTANNLLAAMIDNSIQQGNPLNIDPRRITWKRCMDMNDRQLRFIVDGLGGKVNGTPREDGFDITVASEIMAVFCLATSIVDLKARLARIVVGYTYDDRPVTAGDLKAVGAMAAFADEDSYKFERLLTLLRTAEVYLNYAEAKAELGTLTQDDLTVSIDKIRERAGMGGLDMEAANADPDPFLLACYPNVTKSANTGVILEIRRERTVELLMENLRYWDIMRWKEGKTFEQPLLGLYIPAKGEYDIDGDGTPDVYFATKGETPSTTAKLTLVIDQDILFSDGDHGYISPHKNNPGIWDETRDYFYPIPTDDRSLTGGALTQNPGWNDGLNF